MTEKQAKKELHKYVGDILCAIDMLEDLESDTYSKYPEIWDEVAEDFENITERIYGWLPL